MKLFSVDKRASTRLASDIKEILPPKFVVALRRCFTALLQDVASTPCFVIQWVQ
ncbi:hypothetical protein KSP40_PGU015801 [Platanthera guangdongensis]|uniref:Uncharacterized protein n=1 Tax=Platanthera guangdongensis TaxID=2320717 RepID=A0ABR2M1D2_9ASPA